MLKSGQTAIYTHISKWTVSQELGVKTCLNKVYLINITNTTNHITCSFDTKFVENILNNYVSLWATFICKPCTLDSRDRLDRRIIGIGVEQHHVATPYHN